jgi:predicted GIY-YIG superfamily endonuclease
MPHYVYIVTMNRHQERPALLPGMSKDIRKTVQMYRDMPSLVPVPAKERVTLLHLETYANGYPEALERLNAITAATRDEISQLITANNPDWLDAMEFI